MGTGNQSYDGQFSLMHIDQGLSLTAKKKIQL